MADRKYLAVYGKGASEVVGRVITVWRNEDPEDPDFQSMATQRTNPGKGKWSRHLALQDLTGGLNYIGPYPDKDSGKLHFQDIMAAIPEDRATALLRDADEGRLHVLKHVTGELPSLTRLDLVPITPNIEAQLEYGEKKTGIIRHTEQTDTYSGIRWKWQQEMAEQNTGTVLPAGIRAVVPADDPIIPIILTGVREEKGRIRIEGINPLEWKRESFKVGNIAQLKAELETLRNTIGSIRMFRPRKYWQGLLNEAEIIHAPEKDKQAKNDSMARLKNNYETALRRLHQYRLGISKRSDKDLLQLQLAGLLLFRSEGFRETVLLATKLLQFVNDKSNAKKLQLAMDAINVETSKRSLLISGPVITDILELIEDVMSTPALSKVRFGEVDVDKLKPMAPEDSVNDRCRALLRALKEFGGDLCTVDNHKKALVWQMEGNTFSRPFPTKPKVDGLVVLPQLAKKHLDALAEKNSGHMYLSTRDSILVLSACHEEGAESIAKRLSKKIETTKDYITPNARGLIKIPVYRSGYVRRLPHSDVMVQVSPTIADTWVLPTTARKYYRRLMEGMGNKSKTETSSESGNIGCDVAELTKKILSSEEGVSFEKRLSKLEQIASVVSDKGKAPKNEEHTGKRRTTDDPRG